MISRRRIKGNAKTNSQTRQFRALIVLVAAVFWSGMLIGVSFLATPVKFLAPSLSLAVALDVGRHTFAAFSKVEWGLSLILLALLVAGLRERGAVVIAGIVAVLVAVEALWLLPVLDQRVGMIMAGQTPPPSRLHMLYIVFETLKLLGLIAVAVIAARVLIRGALVQPLMEPSGQKSVIVS